MIGRDESIDIARGVAIILIVIGHVLRGVVNAGLVDEAPQWFTVTDRAVYMVHLPVFAAAAGLMVPGSFKRRGAGPYLRERLVDFAWIYILWSLLQGALQYALADSVNHGRSFASVFMLWIPTNQMWFLPWITAMSVAIVIIRPWESRIRLSVGLGLASVVSITMWGVFGPMIFVQGLGLTVFYFFGASLGLTGYHRMRARLNPPAEVLLFSLFLVIYLGLVLLTPATAPTSAPQGRSTATVALGVVSASAGVLSIFAGSVLAERNDRLHRLLAFLGRHSMVIFLAHTMALAATRIVLLKAGISSLPLHILVGVLGGITGSLIAWWATRSRVPALWSAPALLRGRALVVRLSDQTA